MARIAEIKQTQLRKNELIAESDSLRRQWSSAFIQLQGSARWLDTAVILFRTYRPMLQMVTPFTGYLVARKWRLRLRLWKRSRWLWKMSRALWRKSRHPHRTPAT
jgi:hypothetical protein